MTKQLYVVVPDDWDNNRRGEHYELLMGRLLGRLRYQVVERVRFTAMEIHLLLKHHDFHIQAFAECKFQQDPISAGILTDLLGKALVKGCSKAILFTSSRLGKEAKGLEQEYTGQIELKVYEPNDLYDFFAQAYDLAEPALREVGLLEGEIGARYLLALTEGRFLYAFEVTRNGVPSEVVCWTATHGLERTEALLKEASSAVPAWSDLDCRWGAADPKTVHMSVPDPVATVAVAEGFSDYRPCRPADFIGRDELQKVIEGFLTEVRDATTPTRLLCISGPSGFGKSSLLIKLRDRSDRKGLPGGVLMYPIDTRSASNATFVAHAVRQALSEAQRRLPSSLFHQDVEIQSTSSYLGSESARQALAELQDAGCLLVLFFDQFEETFVKAELADTFRAFQRLAYEVESLQTNVVLGFSWRTGLALPEDLPTYYSWHTWQDRRFEIKVPAFSNREAAQMLTLLQKHMS